MTDPKTAAQLAAVAEETILLTQRGKDAVTAVEAIAIAQVFATLSVSAAIQEVTRELSWQHENRRFGT